MADNSVYGFGKAKELQVNLLAHIGNLVSGDADRESKLVAAAQRGSREAFDTLVHAHEKQLRGYLVRKVGTSSADDVLQDTWLAAWQALPGFTRRGRFRAWLYSVAFHKCMDYHRSKSRAPVELPLEDTIRAPELHDWSASAELQQNILNLIAQLPEDQRVVLDLYYYGELTLGEIAVHLPRNLNTVKSQFYRAHASIALQFEQTQQNREGVVVMVSGR